MPRFHTLSSPLPLEDIVDGFFHWARELHLFSIYTLFIFSLWALLVIAAIEIFFHIEFSFDSLMTQMPPNIGFTFQRHYYREMITYLRIVHLFSSPLRRWTMTLLLFSIYATRPFIMLEIFSLFLFTYLFNIFIYNIFIFIELIIELCFRY